jgi:hypothetical protein
MAALEAVPIGRMVRVDGVDWVRTEKGLARDDTDLRLLYFEGRIVQGQVVNLDDAPPAVGEWWGGSTRTYYLTRVTDTHVHYISWRNETVYNWNGSSRRASWADSATLHRLTGAPSALENSGATGWAVQYQQVFNEYQDSQTHVRTLIRERDELRERVTRQAAKPVVIRDSINAIRANLDRISQLMEE